MCLYVFVSTLDDEVALNTSRLSTSPKSAFYSLLASKMAEYVGNITEYMAKFNLADTRLYFFKIINSKVIKGGCVVAF